MTIIGALTRSFFIYSDDFGNDVYVRLADSTGDAGALERCDYDDRCKLRPVSANLHLRHVRVRSVLPDGNKKVYKNIPVQKTSSLWTGPLGQRLMIAEHEFETIKKVDEKEYGRKGAAAARREIKEAEAQEIKL